MREIRIDFPRILTRALYSLGTGVIASLKVMISGLTAAGKTTHSRLLAREFDLTYISGSTLLFQQVRDPVYERPLDFWISDESFALDEDRIRSPHQDFAVDRHLKVILEQSDDDMVFDVWTLPWQSCAPALRIWLESSHESRVMKAIVSYRGTSRFSGQEVSERLAKRDQRTRDFFLHCYGFDLFNDRTPFDVILDISDFITDPTPEASEISIASAQEILSALVAWHSGSDPDAAHLVQCFIEHSRTVFVRLPSELDQKVAGAC